MTVVIERWALVELVRLAARAARTTDDLGSIDAALDALAKQKKGGS